MPFSGTYWVHYFAAIGTSPARHQKMSQECIDYAHDLKIQALAKIGQLLEETPKNTGMKGSVLTGSGQVRNH